MQDTSRKRDIDLVKTIAIFCVICIHSCGNGYYYPIGSLNWLSTVFWGSISRAGVPLFWMCSGALMMDPEKELPLRKLYGRNLLRLLLALFFWAAVYGLFRLIKDNDLSIASLIRLGKDLLLFRHEDILYFIHIMLLVYVTLPATRVLTANATREQLLYCLIVWFALGILYPTVAPLWPFRLYSGIPQQWALNLAWASIGYCLLGYYLRRYAGRNKRVYFLLFFAGFAAAFGGTWLLSVRNASFISNLLQGISVNICLMSIGIYGLCLDAQPGKWAVFFSKASFCIYLSHKLIILLFQEIGFTSGFSLCIVSIPLLATSATACSVLLYLILHRIPFVKRWLI